MSLTPETLVRHELAGLPVRIADASDPTLVDRSGRVVRETAGTLCVETATGRIQVQKAGTRFAFECAPAALHSEAGADEAPTVTVDGAALLSRPERRTEQEVNTRWQSDWT